MLLAVALWLVSFALPTIDMAGRGVAPGFLAAFYALFLAPTVGRLIDGGSIGGADLPFALLMATYFPLLAIANIVVPLSLARRLDLGVLRIVSAVLATGVMLVPFRELWVCWISLSESAYGWTSATTSGCCRSGFWSW